MEKLGVIGGMGPEATSYFYDQVVRHTAATCDQEHLNMVILSCASMPDRTRAIETGDHAGLLAEMRAATAALEGLGCGHIAIPCNTSHYFYDAIQATTSVPVIHMPREAARYAVAGAVAGECDFDPERSGGLFERPIRRIGIMGTDGTVDSGVYADACALVGAEGGVPSAPRQRDVMSLIYDDVKAGREPDLDKFDRCLLSLTRALRPRDLACTELSVLGRYRAMPPRVLDAMDALVRESIIRCGGVYRV